MSNDDDLSFANVVIQKPNCVLFENFQNQKPCDSTTHVSAPAPFVKRVNISENKTVELVPYYERACREKITPLSVNNPYDLPIIKKIIDRKNKQANGKIIKKTRRPFVPLTQKHTVLQVS